MRKDIILKYSRELRIANTLMAHVPLIDNIGLLNGKMGIVLYLFYLGRIKNNEIFIQFAERLFDEIIDSLHADLPVDFENGITGIGWVIEYFIRNGFIDGDADDVLEEIDTKVKWTFIHRECTLDEIISIGYYLMSRISYRADNYRNTSVLDIKYHLILLIDEIERQVRNGYVSFFLHNLLHELYKLNIFNYKVDKLLGIIEKDTYSYLIPYVPCFTPLDIERTMNNEDVKSQYAGFSMEHIPVEERWGLKKGIAGFGLQKICIESGL